MYNVHYLNKISPKGTELFTEDYQTTENVDEAEAILVRSAAMHDMTFSKELLAVARAGAGVNNIPLDRCAEEGIVVFNTPGANANGVKEMAICGMLLGSRDVVGGIQWVQSIKNEGDVAKKVEKGKSQFAGNEIMGKSLGVIGLGAIGGPLANAAIGLGMKVYGYDPYISINAAWHLDSHIVPVKTLDEIYEKCDIITIHVPLMDSTKHMINAETLAQMKDGVIILNTARGGLINEADLRDALVSGKVYAAASDVTTREPINADSPLLGLDNMIITPHIAWAATEARQRLLSVAIDNVRQYLAGNVQNNVAK